MDYRTEQYQNSLRRLARVTAAARRGELRFNGVLFAGAMAEALLESEVRARDLPQRLAFDARRPAIPARSPTETMALCACFRRRSRARAFSQPNRRAGEAQAVKALGPTLTDCLKKGMKLNLNRPRCARLALAGWRIASTPRKATS